MTALGDEMDEAACIESAARGGVALASKHVIERLGPQNAAALGLDPDDMTYATLESLEASSDKARRDAGPISVTVM